MSKLLCAFNESNLAVMGLYDTVYDMYIELKHIYNSTIKQLDTTKPSFPEKVDDMCRNQVRQVIESFLSSHTSFFSNDYVELHINAYGLKGFSMLETKHGANPLQVIVSYITFRSFLDKFLMVVVRIIAQRRNRQAPYKAIDIVFEEVNQYIDSLAAQYRKRIPMSSVNQASSENNHLFVYSQFSQISCNQKKHHIVPDAFCAEKCDGSGFYSIPIHCCETCGRKFVGKYTLDYYQKEFGPICIVAQKDSTTDSPNAFPCLNQESELHAQGYNVVEGQMSEEERRCLLISLLQSRKMTFFEISRDIKNAIHMQQHLPLRTSAVAKWKRDLEFLSKYIESHSEFK